MTTRLHATITTLTITSLALLATSANAQDPQQERQQPRDQSDLPVRSEGWYGPSDWFDVNTGVDYDYDYDPYAGYGYDYVYSPYFGWYNPGGVYGTTSYDPYYMDPYNPPYGYVYFYDPDHERTYDTRPYTHASDEQTEQDQRAHRQSMTRTQSRRDRPHNRGAMQPYGHGGQRYEDQNRRRADHGPRYQLARTHGTIKDLETVPMFGKQQLCAKIKTPQGKTNRVHLGPKDKLRKLNLSEGDEITVYGAQKLLSASRIRVNDRTIRLDREWDTAMARMQQPVELRGRIDTLKEWRADGETHYVAYLENRDGWMQRVDLGTKQELNEAKLNEGDQIRVRGHRSHLNGVAVIIAHQFRIDHRNTNTDKTDQEGRSVHR